MQHKKFLHDALLFSVLSVILLMSATQSVPVLCLVVNSVLLNVLAYRYGLKVVSVSVIASVIASGCIILLVFAPTNTQPLLIFLQNSYINGSAVLPALFAKNVHRTLNNKKMPSVWLNVVVAQSLVAVLLFVAPIMVVSRLTLMDSVLLFVTTVGIVMLIAYVKPVHILTRRSAFLTKKERSKLLND